MQTVLVVGLGEIGSTVYSVLKESGKFQLFGIDVDKKKMADLQATEPPSTKIDVLQICIPVVDQQKFLQITQNYLKKHMPNLTIINSTVPIGTTMALYRLCGGQIAHSPCRGVHKNKEYMIKEFLRWAKFVGGATTEAGKAAAKHFELAGLKTVILANCTDTEFAKLFETTYRTWMIVFFQKMSRLARKYNSVDADLKIDFDQAVEFIEDTHQQRHDRPVMFPDAIGGHCLLPNSKLMLNEFEPEMLQMILKSNTQTIEELKNPIVAAETRKVAQRVSKYEKIQDKNVMGDSC